MGKEMVVAYVILTLAWWNWGKHETLLSWQSRMKSRTCRTQFRRVITHPIPRYMR